MSGKSVVQKSVHPAENHSYGLSPCAHIRELENAVNMVPDGKLRQIQMGRDFLVRKAFCQKIHKLALAESEIQGHCSCGKRDLLWQLRDQVKECCAELRSAG